MKKIVDIYRCSKKQGLYLYVNKGQDLQELPAALINSLGQCVFSMSLLITKDKKLARVEASDILDGLQEQGFFLQMPPAIHEPESI